jgi:PTH1 family peptidyl-tRNA hydrolase
MKLILGLGNKGEEYAKTRHNVSWILFDEIFGTDGWDFSKYSNSDFKKDFWGDEEIGISKPQTFMNKSGETLSYISKKNNLKGEEIMVVYDDIDLELGTIRISFDKGDAGHNGIKSLVDHFKSKAFVRVRIGIADNDLSKKMERNKFVLANFKDEELDVVKKLAPKVEQILKDISKSGHIIAMNRFN